jgi:tetratricopeptide (TPR) repeat protein
VATVSLCVITDELGDQLYEKLMQYVDHFDEVLVQVNGSITDTLGKDIPAHKLAYIAAQRNPDITISGFAWNDNFSDARNALLKEVKTDYWMWMDTDDEIGGIDHLREVIDHMESTGVSIMFAPYDYAFGDVGVIETQFRERIIKTDTPGAWQGTIHETFIPTLPVVTESTDKLAWIHRKTKEEHEQSMLRNRAILEQEYRKTPRDPRSAYYLGLNYGMDKRYREAIECFQELINTGGWDEERYRAYLQIFSCNFELKEYAAAIDAALQATTELPEWPDAYLMLQQVYYEVDDHQKSYEWFKVAVSKPTPVSPSAFNPIVRGPQPLYLAATSKLFLGKAGDAMKLFMQLDRSYPDYPVSDHVKQVAVEAYHDELTIEQVKALINGNVVDPVKILDALPNKIRGDVRLTNERRKYIPGKKWAKGSIAIYCGPSYETWGPDTLEQGMGGSEEAVVYLSRALGEVGQATVYNQREERYIDAFSSKYGAIDYTPWQEINPNDEFDTFIAWRAPGGTEHIKARRKLLDLHDIIPTEDVYASMHEFDKIMFKSRFHRELYPEVPDDKAVVIGNGIVKSQFS